MDTDTNETPRPDAVLYGQGFAEGDTHPRRIHSSLDKLEPILGGQTYIRDIGGGRFLATRGRDDTLNFVHGHEKALQPRYTWVDAPGGGGVKYGTLVLEAR